MAGFDGNAIMALLGGSLIEGPKIVSNGIGTYRDIKGLQSDINENEVMRAIEAAKTGAETGQYNLDQRGYITPEARARAAKYRDTRRDYMYGQEALPYADKIEREKATANIDLDAPVLPQVDAMLQRSGVDGGVQNPVVQAIATKAVGEVANMRDLGAANRVFRTGNAIDDATAARLASNNPSHFSSLMEGFNKLQKPVSERADEANQRNFMSSAGLVTTPSERTGKFMPYGEAVSLINQAAADYPVKPEFANQQIDNLRQQYEKTYGPMKTGKIGRTSYTYQENLMGDQKKDVQSVAPVVNVNTGTGKQAEDFSKRFRQVDLGTSPDGTKNVITFDLSTPQGQEAYKRNLLQGAADVTEERKTYFKETGKNRSDATFKPKKTSGGLSALAPPGGKTAAAKGYTYKDGKLVPN